MMDSSVARDDREMANLIIMRIGDRNRLLLRAFHHRRRPADLRELQIPTHPASLLCLYICLDKGDRGTMYDEAGTHGQADH